MAVGDRARGGFAQHGLGLDESFLDRIKTGAVGRQVSDECFDLFEGVSYACSSSGQVVHDADVADLEFLH